jgi:hypothetical protein
MYERTDSLLNTYLGIQICRGNTDFPNLGLIKLAAY